MAKRKPTPAGRKKVKSKAVKVRTDTAQKLEDLAEAKGWPMWQVVDDLLAATLPAEWQAAQPQLKRIRELAAKTEEIRAAVRGESHQAS